MNGMNSTADHAPVYFCYRNPEGFSGQKAATELVLKGLSQRGRDCRSLPLPVFDRSGGSSWSAFRYLWELIFAWTRSLRMLGEKEGWFYINLGQTRAAFFLDAVPLLIGRFAFGRNRMIASLHSSLFMTWRRNSIDLWIFQRLLGNVGCITVLGERQKSRLVDLGLPSSRIQVVVNSCEIAVAGDELVQAKHEPMHAAGAVHTLYLSGLYATKGYPEYLEALHKLSTEDGPRIEAVLCGCLVSSDFSDRFPNQTAAGLWIEARMAEINRSARVRVRWVRGARGAAKEALFKNTDIFVLPTRYVVEAQPLVLLEAMASGCAILTTHAGEIDTILDEDSAMFLPSVSSGAVATALTALIANPALRHRLATAAHARYREHYQLNRHIDQWEGLFGHGNAGLRRRATKLPVTSQV